MVKRTESEIRRSIAIQNDTVSPPRTRKWAEIEQERLAAIGKSHLGPLEILAKFESESTAITEQQKKNRKRRKRRSKKRKLSPKPQP